MIRTRSTLGIFVLVSTVTLALAGCSSHHPNMKVENNLQRPSVLQLPELPLQQEPALLMVSSSKVGFAPLTVTFSAVLKNVSVHDEAYNCLWEEWHFGDGAVSGEQRNCVPLTDNSSLNTEFLAEHTYHYGGVYAVQFRLGNLVSNKVYVRVLSKTGEQL